MKIGIITFHHAPNYGAALQAFALQTHLQKMGHDPFFINYHYGLPPRKGLLRWVGSTTSATIDKIGCYFRQKPFHHFSSEHLNIGHELFYDHVQLQSNPPEADAYICGSDQVWNPHFMSLAKDEHAFWLDFGAASRRRIAYAASFGVSEIASDVRVRYAHYAKRFSAIGVREQDGVDLVRRLGRHDAVWVPDPTLLLVHNEYTAIENHADWRQEPYLFSYILGVDNTQHAARVNAYVCEALGVGCYEVFGPTWMNRLFTYIGPSPREWLSRLRQSRYVVTNSFHATVFSILFHKPFIALLRTGRDTGMNSRITSLLDVVGLRDRALTTYDFARVEELYHKEVDWKFVETRVSHFREDGVRFLKDNLP